jgi:hypothetical protein
MKKRPLLLPLLVLAVGAAIWWQGGQQALPAVPACTWRIGDRPTAATQFEKIATEAPVRLAVAADRPWHWYVASWSQEDGLIALFPTPQLTTSAQNPIGVGRTLLPGKFGEHQLSWPMRGGVIGVTSFLAIASREPLPELAAYLATLRQASNQAFPDGSMSVANPKAGEPVDGPNKPLSQPMLRKAFDLDASQHNGPMAPMPGRGDIYIAHWRALCAGG